MISLSYEDSIGQDLSGEIRSYLVVCFVEALERYVATGTVVWLGTGWFGDASFFILEMLEGGQAGAAGRRSPGEFFIFDSRWEQNRD